VLRARVIRVAILLIRGITVTGTIRPQQPAGTRPAAGASATEKRADGRRDFVRDGVCRECHQAIAETYVRTNHHLTLQLPSKESIAGQFSDGENIQEARDPDLHFRMDEKPSGFYERQCSGSRRTRRRALSDLISWPAPGKKARGICTGEAISFSNCRRRTGRN
jgi:hypothetical protein